MDSNFHVSLPLNTGNEITKRHRPDEVTSGYASTGHTGAVVCTSSTGGNDRPQDTTPWGQTKVFRSKHDKKRLKHFRRLQKARGNR